MRPVRVLHTADLHLDTALGASLPGGLARRRREELRETFDRITGLARERGVEVLLVAGDFLEEDAARSLVRHVNARFGDLSNTRVFIAPGNHDPATPDSVYRTFPWAPNVHIFDREEWTAVELPGLNLVVHGLGWSRREIRQPLLRGYRVPGDRRAHVVLMHGDLAGREGETPYLPVTAEDIEGCGADYVALGHLHGPRMVEKGKRILGGYPGSPEPLGFGEPGEHGVWLGTVARGKVEMEFIPTASRRYVIGEVRVSPGEGTGEVAEAVRQAFEPASMERDFFRVNLVGLVDAEEPVELAAIREALHKDFYYLELVDATVPDYDLEELKRQHRGDMLGLFVTRLEELLQQARQQGSSEGQVPPTGPWATGPGEAYLADNRERPVAREEILRRALYYGLDALMGRKVVVP